MPARAGDRHRGGRYGRLGVAAIISVLIVLIGVSGAAQGIAQDAVAQTATGCFGLISPFALVQAVQTWLFRQPNLLPAGPPGTVGRSRSSCASRPWSRRRPLASTWRLFRASAVPPHPRAALRVEGPIRVAPGQYGPPESNELVTRPRVLQPVIDKLRLNTAPAALADQITASSPLDTALVDVTVTDPSPQQASDIANAVATAFPALVNELETPSGQTFSPVKVSITRTAKPATAPVAPAGRGLPAAPHHHLQLRGPHNPPDNHLRHPRSRCRCARQ